MILKTIKQLSAKGQTMSNPETKEQLVSNTADAITSAIQSSRDNAVEAVISIVESYKKLQLPAIPKDSYDLGARDSIDTLLIHLNKFAEGLKQGRTE
jgi:hypothetical protein